MLQLAYGHAISSDVDLDLPPADSNQSADIEIRALDAAPNEAAARWLSNEPDTGWRIGRLGPDFVLAFTESAWFTISADGQRLGWWADDVDDPTLTHLILDHVIPTALSRFGHVVLHAAVVGEPDGPRDSRGGAIAIAGQSGWGKSTVGSALAGRGYDHVADDCAAITLPPANGVAPRRPVVAPAYPGARLHPHSVELARLVHATEAGEVASHSTKRRYAINGDGPWRGRRMRPIDMIFILDPPPGNPDCVGHRLSPAETLFSLVGHSFHLGDGEERRSTFDRLAAVAEAVDVVQLHYERSETGLARLLDEIEQWWHLPTEHRFSGVGAE